VKITIRLACLLGIAVIASALGCAAGYHDYPECRVNCRYCAPSPLPYAHYSECVCHSCAASKYLSGSAPSVVEKVAPLDDIK
jgi:hypothetical protein